MTSVDALSVTAVLGVLGFYFFSWMIAGRKPGSRSIPPQYEPPQGFSPAMVRYLWKECFDDRTFWSSVLSLVSKDLATIETDEGIAVLRPKGSLQHSEGLPDEERHLLKRVRAGSKRNGIAISLLDEDTAFVASEMADALRRSAVGTLFLENRNYVIAGIFLSLLALCLVARPSSRDEWMALLVGLGVMAPGAFYLVFLLLRLRDVFVAAREKLDGAVVRRACVLVGLVAPCVAAIALGCVVLLTTFGWPTIAAAVLFTGLTLVFSHRIKSPTAIGRTKLDQIEGFRLFLQSVERLPMDRADAPSDHAGIYEKYLPYAVALEVDQRWSDKLVALASTVHHSDALAKAHSFYLGMWEGKPVEMVFTPRPPGSRF